MSELKKDVVAGFDHILLVRGNEIKRAQELYDKIYSKYSEFSPVLITSANSSKDRKQSLDKIKKSESRMCRYVWRGDRYSKAKNSGFTR